MLVGHRALLQELLDFFIRIRDFLLAVALNVQVQFPLSGQRLLPEFIVDAFGLHFAAGHLVDALQEVFALRFLSGLLRVVVDFNFSCEYIILLVLLVNELVSDL